MTYNLELCEYRGHLCQVIDRYDDDEADLLILGEVFTHGQFGICECERTHFNGITLPKSQTLVTDINLVAFEEGK